MDERRRRQAAEAAARAVHDLVAADINHVVRAHRGARRPGDKAPELDAEHDVQQAPWAHEAILHLAANVQREAVADVVGETSGERLMRIGRSASYPPVYAIIFYTPHA